MTDKIHEHSSPKEIDPPRTHIFRTVIQTCINAGHWTVPALGAVLSMTTVPVLALLTRPTEFSAHTLMMFGLPNQETNTVLQHHVIYTPDQLSLI